jgi:hypothetical protein
MNGIPRGDNKNSVVIAFYKSPNVELVTADIRILSRRVLILLDFLITDIASDISIDPFYFQAFATYTISAFSI